MKTSLKERKYVEMHVSILESGDGGTIKENIARGNHRAILGAKRASSNRVQHSIRRVLPANFL